MSIICKQILRVGSFIFTSLKIKLSNINKNQRFKEFKKNLFHHIYRYLGQNNTFLRIFMCGTSLNKKNTWLAA